MKRSHDDKHCSTPIEYLIPRFGTIHRVRILGRDELRVFRTELELLRRIARAVRFQASTRPVGRPKTLPAESYLELDQILHDASHSLIETTIARIDLEFADLRKDIVMSVVDEEAKNIVTEATEAGMNTTAPPDESAAPDVVDEMSVDEALDVAQAGLAATVAGDSSVPAESSTHAESPSAAPEPTAEDTVVPCEPEQAEAAAIEPDAADECVANESSEPEECVADEPMVEAECVADAPSEPVEATDASLSDASSAEDSSTVHGLDIGAEQVENAVAVIERGIRNLASTLKGELHEQWTRANSTLEEVNDSRAKIDEERQSTLEMLEEITRLRDEAKAARDEAEAARRDAKLQRESARVAKERAETSAAIAELAAEQAGRDARAFREPELQTVDA